MDKNIEPEKKELVTKVTKEDLANGVMDEQRVIYSPDGKRLLECKNADLTQCVIRNNTEVICEYAFSRHWNLGGEVKIPDSVLAIGTHAFWKCHKITSVILGNSVATIEYNAFGNCKSLTSIEVAEDNPNYRAKDGVLFSKDGKILIQFPHNSPITSYTIPMGVTEIKCAFKGCSSLIKIVMPGSVTRIWNYAFEECSHLAEITLSNSLTEIEDSVFAECSSLTKIVIPDGVTRIGSRAFINCYGLVSLTLNDGLKTIDFCAFEGCRKLMQVTIPIGVEEIGNDAFCNCSSLTKIVIPDSVVSIGFRTFRYCFKLASVVIPDGVTRIEKLAFDDCRGLSSLSIGKGVTVIGESAFSRCKSLSRVYIPDSVVEIEAFAFEECESLSSLTLGNNVAKIGFHAFGRCERLKKVRIPASVTELWNNAFWGCKGLTCIEVAEDNPNYCAKDGVLFSKDGTELLRFPPNSPITSYTIPMGVTLIAGEAFEGCLALKGELNIPNSVETISCEAFNCCEGLTAVNIPKSVINIGCYAFKNCSSLTRIFIPESVIEIRNDAFEGCKGLTCIEVAEDNPNYCTKDGVLFSKDGTKLLRFPPSSPFNSYSIPVGVREIIDNAFSFCVCLTEDVAIPESVISIGLDAFYACRELKAIYSLNPTPPKCKELYNVVALQGIEKSECVLHVPKGSREDYSHAVGWRRFDHIEEME